MQVNIIWAGREYHSLENCLVTTNVNGAEITSAIVGSYHHDIYKAEYLVRTNRDWATIFCRLKTQVFDKTEELILESDGNGNWIKNGEPAKELDGCMEVDIPLTPLTNTLPINRTKLAINETQEISVIYLDILSREIKPVRQKYTRLSQTQYKYENVPNDFEAVITVDAMGLVVDYPQLFVRTEMRESDYQLH